MKAVYVACKTKHYPNGRTLFTICFRCEDGKSARLYTQKSFGNFVRSWSRFILTAKKGTVLDNLMWLNEKKRIINADSMFKIAQLVKF